MNVEEAWANIKRETIMNAWKKAFPSLDAIYYFD